MDTERRRSDDKNWEEIRNFIEAQILANTESREYRIRDDITQKYQVENIEALKNQVTKQNGRVGDLEKWREEIKANIQNRKDVIIEKQKADLNRQQLVTVIATIVMAVSALVMIFKHG